MPTETPGKVVDASAVAAILFAEPTADDLTVQLADSTLFAPRLLRYEVASVCLKKLRRYPGQRNALLAAYSLLDRMPIQEIDVPLTDVLLLAEQEALTIYDACYVWLARSLGVELVTLDAEVRRAFRRLCE